VIPIDVKRVSGAAVPEQNFRVNAVAAKSEVLPS